MSIFGKSKIEDFVKVVDGMIEASTVLNANIWTTTASAGGTVANASNLVTLRTNSTPNASVLITTIDRGRFIPPCINFFHGKVALGDAGVANNTRRWGAFDANNGVFFQLQGTTVSVVTRSGGVDTVVTSFNGGNAFLQDTVFHTYEIYWNSISVEFLQDNRLIHTIQASGSTVMMQNVNLTLAMQNTNSSGAASDVSLLGTELCINRLGNPKIAEKAKNSGSSETVTLKTGPGRLHRIFFSRVGGLGNTTFTVYDNTAASGKIIYQITVAAGEAVSSELEMEFSIGLTYVNSSNTHSITVIWD